MNLTNSPNLNTRENIKKSHEKIKVYKKYYLQAEIDALPMIEIDPLTNMFKNNNNIIRRWTYDYNNSKFRPSK